MGQHMRLVFIVYEQKLPLKAHADVCSGARGLNYISTLCMNRKGSGKSTHLPLNACADVSRGARGLKFGLCLHLHPYFVYTSSEGSGESVQTHLSFPCSTIQ